jgi:dTDP-4-dehydrorhamnose reductase
LTQLRKAYIAGCGGMLGEAAYRILSESMEIKASDINVRESWLEFADVRDLKQISNNITEFDPDIILNLAARTDLEYCEKNSDEAWATNALGAENIGVVANQLNVPLVYISTAGIFDGEQDVYSDYDLPNPLSIYAKSKYYGERFVLERVPKCYVLRAGWMMGGGPALDKKFVNKIFKQINSGSKELYVVDDKLGTPTFTDDFIRSTLNVIQTGYFGLYNQVCEGDCSRYDVAVEFVKLLGLEGEVAINLVDSDYFGEEYFAPRPASEKLSNTKLKARGINTMRNWEACLAEYAEEFKSKLSL